MILFFFLGCSSPPDLLEECRTKCDKEVGYCLEKEDEHHYDKYDREQNLDKCSVARNMYYKCLRKCNMRHGK